jgi:hypothetical protein
MPGRFNAPAVATLPCAMNGWSTLATLASSTHGRVVRSVQAGTPASSRSFARISAPEHCEPTSCRFGSSVN